MKNSQAKALAAEWVFKNASDISGYSGAYLMGSILTAPENDELSHCSDVDIAVIIGDTEREKPGKFDYKGALLEVTYIPLDTLLDRESLLCTYELAGSIYKNTPIDDPKGELKQIFEYVNENFAKQRYIAARCEAVFDKIIRSSKISASRSFIDNALSCIFSAGITTHAVLVAALKNPTVRLRYLRSLEILSGMAMLEFYNELVCLAGFDRLTVESMRRYVGELEPLFDEAAACPKNLFFFSSDISRRSRSIAIDGSYELIEKGFHREAAFWVGATYWRCHKILEAAGKTEISRGYQKPFLEFAEEIGIGSFSQMKRRTRDIKSFLPHLKERTKIIAAAHADTIWDTCHRQDNALY